MADLTDQRRQPVVRTGELGAGLLQLARAQAQLEDVDDLAGEDFEHPLLRR